MKALGFEKMKHYTKYYKVAGLSIQINSDFPITVNTFHPKFRLFESDGPEKENVLISHHFSIPAKIHNKIDHNDTRLIFSNKFLSVFKAGHCWIYEHKYSEEFSIKYNAIVVFNEEHTIGNVYTNDIDESAYSKAKLGSVVLFGGDHYLMSNILSCKKGILIHANGLAYNDKGIVLVGKSGAGKSTLSRMLKDNGFKVIADDRIILQRKKSGVFLVGSWCHGSIIEVANREVLVDKIFFLEQSLENKIIIQNSNHEKLKQLANSIVRPFGDRKKWADILNLVEDIMKERLFYSLYFDLSGDICKIIKEELCDMSI